MMLRPQPQPDEHTALQDVATREQRTLSAMARRYILAGLRADGLLLPSFPGSAETSETGKADLS